MKRKDFTSNTVRITGGYLRGRKIKTPGTGTHPMGERERIALFNMINDYIKGSSVIDLYCGGGTLGIEALSRGATSALFIDKNPRAIAITNENLSSLGIPGASESTLNDTGTVSTAIADITQIAHTITDKYDIVIADPPYDIYNEEMVKYFPRLVQDGGTLVLSHPGDPPKLAELTLEKTRSYARATISIYCKDI